jgi:hypothetical protein
LKVKACVGDPIDLRLERLEADGSIARVQSDTLVTDDPAGGCCQSRRNKSSLGRSSPKSHARSVRDCKPPGQSSCASLLVDFTAEEVTFLVEMVVEGRVDRGELLKHPYAPEPQHGPFSSSEGLV